MERTQLVDRLAGEGVPMTIHALPGRPATTVHVDRRLLTILAVPLLVLAPITLVELTLGLSAHDLVAALPLAWLLLVGIVRGCVDRITRPLDGGAPGQLQPVPLSASRTREAVVLVGRGAGVDELRELLAGMQTTPGRAVVVVCPEAGEGVGERASLAALQALCRCRRVRLVTLVGLRGDCWAADGSRLVQTVPWIADADLFASGPGPWVELVAAEAAHYGTAAGQVHRAVPAAASAPTGDAPARAPRAA